MDGPPADKLDWKVLVNKINQLKSETEGQTLFNRSWVEFLDPKKKESTNSQDSKDGLTHFTHPDSPAFGTLVSKKEGKTAGQALLAEGIVFDPQMTLYLSKNSGDQPKG